MNESHVNSKIYLSKSYVGKSEDFAYVYQFLMSTFQKIEISYFKGGTWTSKDSDIITTSDFMVIVPPTDITQLNTCTIGKGQSAELEIFKKSWASWKNRVFVYNRVSNQFHTIVDRELIEQNWSSAFMLLVVNDKPVVYWPFYRYHLDISIPSVPNFSYGKLVQKELVTESKLKNVADTSGLITEDCIVQLEDDFIQYILSVSYQTDNVIHKPSDIITKILLAGRVLR